MLRTWVLEEQTIVLVKVKQAVQLFRRQGGVVAVERRHVYGRGLVCHPSLTVCLERLLGKFSHSDYNSYMRDGLSLK